MLNNDSLLPEIRPQQAFIIATAIIALLGFTIIKLGWVPHIPLLLAICGLLFYGTVKKCDFKAMQDHMARGITSGITAIYLFFFIGLLVVALMLSGGIPTLMYYGFSLINAHYFYLSAFILTAIIGIAIGSSLTTCATLGVAFMGMTDAFHANPAIVAGAIVSGAFFGDKMSPLSDTCSIAASVVGIDLFEHIKNMMYTTVPAFILTVLAFWFLSDSSHIDSLSQVQAIKNHLSATGLIHPLALLPFLVLIILALGKINAIYTIITTIATALLITYIYSTPSLSELGSYFFSGYKTNGDFGEVSKLLSRGGINSMFFTQTIVILALSLGGLLKGLGILPALLAGIRHLLTNAGRATATVASCALGINILIGEQYLSLLLSGNTFISVYKELGLHPKNLSRTLEDAGTVINPLVPWGVCGVFISQTLDISVLSYLPYSFFCYLCLILTLIFGFTGITISQTNTKKST